MFELLRVEFRVVALARDEDGTVTGEQSVVEGAAYPAGLDRIADAAREAIEKANAESHGTASVGERGPRELAEDMQALVDG